MSRIICITGWFKKYDKYGFPTSDKEFLVSHGINEDDDSIVVLPNEHPECLGAKFDKTLGEYVIE